MASPSPIERRLAAARRAHISWANTVDRSARTRNARDAFEAKFLREADPDLKLDPVQRAAVAASLRKAYYLNLTLKSAEARRKKKSSS